MLLVDSEAPIAPEDESPQDRTDKWLPWNHLKKRDLWDRPGKSPDADCHLMVQCMESWFLADPQTLKAFFGQGFREKPLLIANNSVEKVGKAQVYDALAKATGDCKTKAEYGKGEHSFKLLAKVDPAKVTASSPWAKRFVDGLKKRMGC
ncbi:DUF4276 family protein [Trinickia symbiotica]|uniref:DUF4276 family protein n=1 Tax=Trinickia symbiotica TaxID=863227 RepID=UPI001C635321|nr:DUF4276 family protein [Trinickia symbiotica]